MINDEYWNNVYQLADTAKWAEYISGKVILLEKLFTSLQINPRTIVLPSFNPVVIGLELNYNCVVIADKKLKATWDSKSIFLDKITDISQPAEICLALDEYLTYADSEQDQRDRLSELSSVTDGYLITTLQDYKNNAPHKRSQVEATLNGINDIIVLEQNISDKINRQNWQNYIYMIANHADLSVMGPNQRRTMYFKQLAKYSSDLGGQDYQIQKNLLYRGFFRKHYEHMITIKFS